MARRRLYRSHRPSTAAGLLRWGKWRPAGWLGGIWWYSLHKPTRKPEMVAGCCLSARERSRQPEPWEHAVVEAGEGADPVAGEGEDEQAGPMADAAGGAKVGPERRLTVGSRRDEVNPPARVEDAGEEPGHDVAALVFEGNRWHGDVDIVGEQGDQRVQIPGLVGADELCHERLLGG